LLRLVGLNKLIMGTVLPLVGDKMLRLGDLFMAGQVVYANMLRSRSKSWGMCLLC